MAEAAGLAVEGPLAEGFYSSPVLLTVLACKQAGYNTLLGCC